MMKSLDQILAITPGLNGAARADASGNVVDAAGQLDAESLCAVAAMGKVPLEHAAELLGLGGLRDFSFSYAQGAFYVHHDGGFVCVVGAPSKSPETIMKKIAQAAGDSF
jgi:hypothetical protein